MKTRLAALGVIVVIAACSVTVAPPPPVPFDPIGNWTASQFPGGGGRWLAAWVISSGGTCTATASDATRTWSTRPGGCTWRASIDGLFQIDARLQQVGTIFVTPVTWRGTANAARSQISGTYTWDDPPTERGTFTATRQ